MRLTHHVAIRKDNEPGLSLNPQATRLRIEGSPIVISGITTN